MASRVFVHSNIDNDRERLLPLLTASGLDVRPVASAAALIEGVAAEANPVLALVAVTAGHMSGYTAIRAAAQTRPNVKVVALLDRCGIDEVRAVVRAGAHDWLVRPYDAQSLARLAALIEGRFIAAQASATTRYACDLPAELVNLPLDLDLRIVELSAYGFVARCGLVLKGGALVDVRFALAPDKAPWTALARIALGERLGASNRLVCDFVCPLEGLAEALSSGSPFSPRT
jgi:CheY-like chemotaxis protein